MQVGEHVLKNNVHRTPPFLIQNKKTFDSEKWVARLCPVKIGAVSVKGLDDKFYHL